MLYGKYLIFPIFQRLICTPFLLALKIYFTLSMHMFRCLCVGMCTWVGALSGQQRISSYAVIGSCKPEDQVFAVRLCLLVMSEAIYMSWTLTNLTAQRWVEQGWCHCICQSKQRKFMRLQPYTKIYRQRSMDQEMCSPRQGSGHKLLVQCQMVISKTYIQVTIYTLDSYI